MEAQWDAREDGVHLKCRQAGARRTKNNKDLMGLAIRRSG